MNRGEQLSSMVERIQEHAGVTAVYGDPIEHDGRTIVPVARVAYGFGGGYGSQARDEALTEDDEQEGGEGSGMGGGVSATPVGVIEVSSEGTRFVPFNDRKKLAAVAGISLVLGYLLGRN